MKRRKTATVRSARDQLSFFDPGGDLPDLREEARRISTVAEHQAFLEQGERRAQVAIAELKAEIEVVRRDAAHIAGSSGDHFQITLTGHGEDRVITDRREAGEALRARMLTPVTDEGLVTLGRFAGLVMNASVIREGGQVIWAPRLSGERNWFRSGTVNDGRHAKLSPHTGAVQIIAQFERVLARITRESDALASGLAANRAELGNFEAQLAAMAPPDRQRLADVKATIHAIEASGGLFGGQANKEEDNDRTATRASGRPVRKRSAELPDHDEAERIRDADQGRPVEGAPGANRQGSRRSLRNPDGADAGDRGDDAGVTGEGHLSQPNEPGRRRTDSGGDHSHLDADGQAARRRDRAGFNFRIRAEHRIGAGTPKEKVAANIAAIRILKILGEEDRPATREEQAALVRYVGWGAFAQAMFDKNPNTANAQSWRKERQELADLITSDEWAAARASTLNAHYTSEPVIRGIWRALDHLGFTGGRVLEPAAGIGHFIGLTPDHLRDDIAWTGVEIDPITGGIAKALYPGADIRMQGFETAAWPNGFFDLAISNVPFGDYAVRDARYRPMSIHDYFFVRSLDKVRLGGVVAFITSRYSLDKETDLARREIARRADFLGAIRLPGGKDGAFARNAGTEVTTDILFLRRRAENQAALDESWLPLSDIDTPDGPMRINSYFAQNPHMLLGNMRLQGSMRGASEPVLIGPVGELEDAIAHAARHMATNAFIPRGSVARHEAETLAAIDTDTDGIREGAFYFREGQVHRKLHGVGTRQNLSRADAEKVKALIEMRDVVNELLARQAAGDPADRGPLRDRLNRTYDAFHRRFGPINKTVTTVSARMRADGSAVIIKRLPNLSVFRDDPDGFKLAAIETYDETRNAVSKAAIFSHDIVQPYIEPVITGPSDALAVSLNQRGAVDMPLIARCLGLSEDEAIEALGASVWLDPAGDVWRTREDYLSGDVVGKLDDARAAAPIDPIYQRNVAALEEAQPAPLTRIDIKVLMGAPWVPVEDYRDFFGEALNIALPEGALTLNPVTKKWQFRTKLTVPDSVQALFGTSRSSALQVVEAAINNAEIRVMDVTADDTAVYNAPASEESNAKVAAIRELFSGSPESGVDGWIWQDEARAARLEALYNTKFNRLAPTRFDGSHQAMPGIVRYATSWSGAIEPFRFHDHQLNAIWRIVSSGNTLIDHAVGAGKTFTMIAAGMEQKRLGLIQRPMFVIPNHMLDQFSREFMQLYPGAKILIADKESMSRAKRREFAARIAAERWDGIVITHDAFGRIAMSAAAYEHFIRREIDELAEFKVRAATEEGKDSPTVKELEKARKRLEARLDKVLNKEAKDEGVTFEELAVDFLFVDEAHAFKNLGFRTRHTRVKGLAAVESQRATDMFLKIQYLEDKRPGRSVVFATGTPVSNTIAEMYTMQRYLQPGLLRSYGIDEFDAWAATFGDIVTQVELAPSGKGFRTTRSFSKFVNIPELVALYSCVADTQTAEMLNLPRPKLKGGAIEIVKAEMSEYETGTMQALVARAEAVKGKRSEKGGDNMLKIMSEGLKLATDIRLLEPDASANPDGKLAKAVLNIHRIWRDGEDPGLAQIVFLDMGVPGSRARAFGNDAATRDEALDDKVVVLHADGEDEAEGDNALLASQFNLYEELRSQLVAKGIPREQIAFIHEADNDVKKGRLFAAVRAGQIRILIGSTAKMGVGTNVQQRLVAMHHLDAPWRPADVEQRDGRILRQGNLNKEVQVFRYITEGSLDAYRWQTLNTKANFIAQLRAGARGVRSAEDIDSPLPEAAMIKAAATGDPRIMEHAELSKEARLLEAARRAHDRSINAARTAHAQTLQRIDRLCNVTAQASEDAAQITDVSSDRFEVILTVSEERVVFTDRRLAGASIHAHLLRVGTRHWESGAAREALGKLSGFRLDGMLRRSAGELQLAVLVEGRLTYSRGEYFALTDANDPIGLMRRFEALIKSVPHYLAAKQSELAKAEADLPRLARQIEAGPFAKQTQLDAAKMRIAQLEKELTPSEEPKAQPAVEGTSTDSIRTTVEALISAGSDEALFDGVFRALQTNMAVGREAAIAIACGFTGKDGRWATREAALGAIETHFYEQSRGDEARDQAPARQSAAR